MLLGLAAALVLWTVPARSQQLFPQAPDTATEESADTVVSPRFPGSFEVVSRALALADSAGADEQRIARLADLDALAARVEANRERENELRELLDAIEGEGYLRPERISRLQDGALAQSARLDALLEDISDRLDRLGELRSEWTERRAFWLAWQDTLRTDPDFELVEPEIGGALERIEEVRERISAVIPTVLALQRETNTFQQTNAEIIEQSGEIRNRRREALLLRDRPVLFSSDFVDVLDDDLLARLRAGVRDAESVTGDFLRRILGLLLLQLGIAVGLALLARRLCRVASPDESWTRLLRHPAAIGIFVAVAVVGPFYGLTPALWDVGVWAALAGSGAALASAMFQNPRKRLLVYLVAGFYPLFLALQAIGLPVPLFRLWLAAAVLAGAVTFWVLAHHNERWAPEDRVFTWLLRAGAALWTFVFAAELVGFDALARWVTQSVMSSAFAVFVVVFLVLLARGGTRTLLSTEPQGRFRFLRRIGYPLAERLVWLLQAVLVFGVGLYLLDVWEIAPSPVQTWNALLDAGFRVGEIEITVGRILWAALAIYLAVLFSWVLRAFLRSEIYGRWELDPGVGDSINKLLHYALIVFGVLFAFGAIGFELQNFAIIAGALGVGIGFGLQNIVNNFVSGLILLFERPVRVGDTLVIGGEWGTIKKIGLRSTTVVTFDQSEMIVPNGDLVSEKVTNWTLSNPVTRLVLPVGVAYGSDLETVFGILYAVAEDHPAVIPQPAPQALFMGFGDSSLDFELRVWVREVLQRPLARSSLLTEIDRRFREAGIEIPFPQRDLHLRSVDAGVIGAAAAEAQMGNGRAEARRERRPTTGQPREIPVAESGQDSDGE